MNLRCAGEAGGDWDALHRSVGLCGRGNQLWIPVALHMCMYSSAEASGERGFRRMVGVGGSVRGVTGATIEDQLAVATDGAFGSSTSVDVFDTATSPKPVEGPR